MTSALRTAAILAFLLPLPSGASAQIAPDWFGTWHLDVARSTFIGTPPYARGTWTVERRDSDEIFTTYYQVGTRGGVTRMEWKGRFDGRDYRMHGPDALVTYAYAVVDERTLDLLVKVDGRPAAASRVVLGSDGTVTATTENSTARGMVTTVTVYTKKR